MTGHDKNQNTLETLNKEFNATPAMRAAIVDNVLIVTIDMMKAFPDRWGVYWPAENGNDSSDVRQLYSDGLTIWYDDYNGDRREITEAEAKRILETPVRDTSKETAPRLSLMARNQQTTQMLDAAMKYDYSTSASDTTAPQVKLHWDFFTTILANASMLVNVQTL